MYVHTYITLFSLFTVENFYFLKNELLELLLDVVLVICSVGNFNYCSTGSLNFVVKSGLGIFLTK